MTFIKRAVMPIAGACAATVFLASCGGTGQEAEPSAPESSEQSAAESNGADVRFAQMMIPHHEQAVEMSDLAETRAGEDVRALAADIEAAQGPEIEQMNAFLESWGEEPVEDTGAMDHGGMDGMMTAEQMEELEQAEGDAFDTMFLEMMIQHHEGAVKMAETEIDEGADPEAKDMAQEIVDTQQSEIEQMNGMLETTGDGGASESESPESSDGQDHGGH